MKMYIKSIKKKIKKKSTKKRKSQQKEFSWNRFYFKLICILFFGITIYVLFFSKLAKVDEININGNQVVNSESILQNVELQMTTKNFLQISKSNFFLVSENKLQQTILDNFPKIKNVEVKKVFPNQIDVSVTEHDLIPIVCIESQEGECFILENDGRIVEKADFDSAKLKENKIVVIIDKNKNDIVEIGKEFILEEKLNNIIFLGEELTYVLNVKIKQPYIIPARGAKEVQFNTGEGWYLQIDTVDDPQISLKVTELFFEKGFNIQHDDLTRYDLEYVDARTNKKVFYKYNKSERIVESDQMMDEDLEEENDEVVEN